MSNKKQRLDLDELKKSLEELEFSPEEIQEVLEKAEKDNQSIEKGMDDEGKGDASDKDVADPKELEKEKMEKAYSDICMKSEELKKSISEYQDKFGNVPGFKTPTDFFTEKSLDADIEKGFQNQSDLIEKAFAGKFDLIEKSFEKMTDGISLKLDEIQKGVTEIASAPNPLKGLFGNYHNKVVEKGVNGEGTDVINLRDRRAALNAFEKSLDKINDEEDKNAVRDLISDFTISKVTNDKALNIVKKALNIDFEK